MKNQCILIIIFFFGMAPLFSCSHSNNGEANVLTDSLIRATEEIAIGKARFGISEREFNELYPDSLVLLDENLYNVSSYFDSSKGLNKVYLVDTATIDNTRFDKALFDRMDLLKQHFIKTYSLPQRDRGYPKQEKMQNGNSFDAYMWEIGKKKIFVGIALEETNKGNIYYVLAHVDKK